MSTPYAYVPTTYVPGQNQSGDRSHDAQPALSLQQSGGVFVPGEQPQPSPTQQHTYVQQQQYQQSTPGNVFVPGQQPQQQQWQMGKVSVPGGPPQQVYAQQQQYTQQQPSATLFQPPACGQPQLQQQMQADVPQQQLDDRGSEQGGGKPYAFMGAAAAGTATVVGASYVAYQHHTENNATYQTEFQKLDANNSGYLERYELEQRFGNFMPKNILDLALKIADKDKDGKVSMNEYVEIRRQIVKLGFATAGVAAVGGAGYLTYQHHNNNKDDYNDPQLPPLQEQQQNQSGMPSYATVGAAAAGTAAIGSAGYMAYHHYQNRPQQGQKTGQFDATQGGQYDSRYGESGSADVNTSYQKEFKRLDADNSGRLEKEEVEKIFGKWIPQSIIDAAMKAVDADKDGKVSMQEYIAIRQSIGGKIPGL